MSSTAAIGGTAGARKTDEDGSSVSSRFVMKLDGLKMESDIISQQEEIFKNKFDEKYILLNKLGEGCSSEVFKCQSKDLP